MSPTSSQSSKNPILGFLIVWRQTIHFQHVVVSFFENSNLSFKYRFNF